MPPTATNMSASVTLFTGRIRPLPDSGRPTGIYKSPATFPLEVTALGFEGDQQADLRVHGGPDKAVHYFPRPHYAQFAARFPELAGALLPGSIGENISAALTETEVRIGDIWCLGSARLQVCQPRNPCWKIDERYGIQGLAKFIAHRRIAGWYLRVLTPGVIAEGDALQIESTDGSPTLHEALELLAEHRPSPDALAKLLQTPTIADNWRHAIEKRASWLRRNT